MSEVIYDRELPAVGRIRINRPDARNALNPEVRLLLGQYVGAASADPEVRCLIITGGDQIFVAGADIKAMADAGPVEMYRRHNEVLWRHFTLCPKPIIAAVNGYALGGGCELAMHADLIIAGENAKFGQPEVKLGIMPGAGGTQRLTRAVGKARALRLLLTGEMISGREAFDWGLVSEVVPDDQVQARAETVAAQIAAMPPLAIRLIKEAVHQGADLPLEQALLLERRSFQLLFDSADKAEGMQAFLEKRPAKFEGR